MAKSKNKDVKKRKNNNPDDYVKMYEEGEKDLSKIAEKYGVSKGTVYAGLRSRITLPKRSDSIMSKYSKKDIISALKENSNITATANALGVTYAQLYSAMKVHKITAKRSWN
jgi:transposase-like protein